ncbi:MAG: DNA helicase PcrA, partial [Clostridium sp.]|nr:DNA helicase PcrA [Clostridium sp.]
MELEKLLNSEQYEAATTIEGPLLILAGAGSGKTRVLTYRIAHMIEEKGISPYDLLAITFTNKAANEMKERIVSLVGNVAHSMWISTFHSSCARILRMDIDKLGYKSDFTIYDTYDQKSLMKQVMEQSNLDPKSFSEKEIRGVISNAKNSLITPFEYKKEHEHDYRKNRIADAYILYQKKLKENNALDFDDIIMKTVELFEKHKDVLEKYREKFKYVMVDEYQDTNHAQYKLVRLLTIEHKNICVVGDDDQSIYKFRGADITNILDFEKDFPDARVIKLEKNYRSVGSILNAANSIIRMNDNRSDKNLITTRDVGEKLKVYKAPTDVAEAMFVVSEIEKIYRDGRKYGEFAILYRTNAQSRRFEERLMKEGIPYRLIGGVKFYERKEIKDIVAYLRIISNPLEEVSLRRIINVPKRSIGEATLGKLSDRAIEAEENMLDIIYDVEKHDILTNRGINAVNGFADLIKDFTKKKEELSVSELVEYILVETGYLKELEESKSPEDLSRVENLGEFVNLAIEYEKSAEEPNLFEFLENIALVSDIDSYDEDEDAVTLMTIHSAKGLEFPAVFIVGMENGLFPSAGDLDSKSDLEEARRLAYVGITRAEDLLYMTYAESRMVYGRTVNYRPSDFLMDIPNNLKVFLRGSKTKSRRKVNPHTLKYGERQQGVKDFNLDEILERAGQIIDSKPKNLENMEIELGSKVKHSAFGEGTIVSKEDITNDVKVTVAFDSKGLKTLMLSLA